MKNLILAIALSLSAANALACANPEAQFSGVVSETQKSEYYQFLNRCYVRVEFTSFQASGICPLDEMEARNTLIEDLTCSLEAGSAVSGYLVVRNGEIVIE